MAKSIRVKKNKIPKILFFVLVVLLGILTSIASMNFNTTINTVETRIEAYETKNLVNNAFTNNDIKYLPIVYKTAYDKLTKEDIYREFRNEGLTIKRISSDTIGTGTQIETDNVTYTLLIYGDVNGDGAVNVKDVKEIVIHILREEEFPKVNKMAANVYNEKEDVINVRDAQKIVQFILGRENIIDSLPEPDINNEISSIEYKEINSTPTNYCYEDILIATIASGKNQRKLVKSDLKDIGCVITNDEGNSKYITEYVSNSEGLGISKVIDDEGVVTISFWAKEKGNYSITPYIMINGVKKEVDAEPVTAIVSEDYTINKITFANTDDTDYFGEVIEGSNEKNTINFYHEYKKAFSKIGEYDEILCSVTRNMISVDYNSEIISNIELGYIDSNGRYVFDDNEEDYITVARVTIAEGVTVDEAEFTITVGNGEPQKFKVKIIEEQKISNLQVGNEEQDTIKIYLDGPTSSEEDSKYDVVEVEGVYYTIIPITFMSGETPMESILKANMIETRNISNRKSDYLYVIDNVNENGEDGTSIDVLGFNWDEESNTYIKREDETIINYIGIAFGYEKEDAEYFFDVSSEYYINAIKIYYNTFGTDGLVKTFDVTSDYNVVNKIVFGDIDNENSFGEVTVGTSKTNAINFYHDERQLTEIITRNMISVDYNSEIISNIELGYIDSNGRYVFDDNEEDYITVARVTIAEGVTVDEAEFTITVGSGEPQKFKVKIIEEQKINNLQVGKEEQDTIKIYLDGPTSSEEDSKYDVVEVEGVYYTIIPITFMSGETPMESILKANMIETTNTSNRKPDYLYVIDNVNENGEDGTSINVLGFNWDEESNTYIESEDETIINYIGIAFGYEKEDAEYFFDVSSEYYINAIKIYYNTFGTNGLAKTFDVTSDYLKQNRLIQKTMYKVNPKDELQVWFRIPEQFNA